MPDTPYEHRIANGAAPLGAPATPVTRVCAWDMAEKVRLIQWASSSIISV